MVPTGHGESYETHNLSGGAGPPGRKRCKQHRHRIGGVCQECVLTEIERAVAEEHPEMKRGDVFELVCEWLMQDDDFAH